MKVTPYEQHDHAFVTGPQRGQTLTHSHEGGSRGHRHEHTGPARFVIDKDAWAAATGLRGGGRKKYAAKPSGPQLPLVPLTREQSTFNVVFVDHYTDGHRMAGISPKDFAAMREGFARLPASGHAVAHMVQAFDMTPIYELRRPDDAEPRR